MYYQPQHALYFRVTCADKRSPPSSFVPCLLVVPSDKKILLPRRYYVIHSSVFCRILLKYPTVLVSDKNGHTPGKITFAKHADSGITMIIQRFGLNNRHKVRSHGDSS